MHVMTRCWRAHVPWGPLTDFKEFAVGCSPPHRQHGATYMLRKILIATVLAASMATPTAAHALIWESNGEAVPEAEAPKWKRGLWKTSGQPPVTNLSEPASVPDEPRAPSEKASTPELRSTPAGAPRINLQFPYLSTLALGI